jgi:hypothetical protein
MWRVLAPGGRVALAVWGARTHCGWADIFPIVEARVQSDVCPMFFQLGTGTALDESLTRAGFTGVHLERVRTELLYDDGDAAADAAFAGGPVAMAYSRFDEDTRAAARADHRAVSCGIGLSHPGRVRDRTRRSCVTRLNASPRARADGQRAAASDAAR